MYIAILERTHMMYVTTKKRSRSVETEKSNIQKS